jgi:Domain of unknown function (DUF4262)
MLMGHQGEDFLRYMATIADRIEAKRLEHPRALGWTVQHVRPSNPGNEPYTYTVGLSVYHRPELVVFSLAESVRTQLLDLAAEYLLADLNSPPRGLDGNIELLPNLRCRVRPYQRPERLRTARAYIADFPGYTLNAWELVLSAPLGRSSSR